MNDINFDLSYIDFLRKSAHEVEGNTKECAYSYEKLCGVVESEHSLFQAECQKEMRKVQNGIIKLQQEIREIEHKKQDALSKKQKEEKIPSPPSIPANCTEEQRNAVMSRYRQAVSQIEQKNAQIRKKNNEIDAYAKKCDEATVKIQEILEKLKALDDHIKKESEKIRARVQELSFKAFDVKRDNHAVATAAASFNYALERAYEMAERIELLSAYSNVSSYDIARQYTIKNSHSHIASPTVFSSLSNTASSNVSSSTYSAPTPQASSSGEITVNEKNADAFFSAISDKNKIAMKSANIRHLGGKAFNAKMSSLGYILITQQNGSIIDKNGMIHWEKSDD